MLAALVVLLRTFGVIVLGERHLRRLLTAYLAYYHGARTHLALEKDAPVTRRVQTSTEGPVPTKNSISSNSELATGFLKTGCILGIASGHQKCRSRSSGVSAGRNWGGRS